MSDLAAVATASVLEAHLRLREAGKLERDIAENYAEHVVLLTHEGVYRGAAGVRHAAAVLARHVADSNYEYLKKHVADDYAYLEWRARGRNGGECHGWDAFVIREGRIVAQMIYFACTPGAR